MDHIGDLPKWTKWDLLRSMDMTPLWTLNGPPHYDHLMACGMLPTVP